jgi:hypothetical protein
MSRLATLATAISMRTPTAPRRTSSGVRASPTMVRRRGSRVTPAPPLTSGYRASRRAAILSISRCAADSSAPSARRPTTDSHSRPRGSLHCRPVPNACGVHSSALRGYPRPGAVTPTTSKVASSSSMVRPRTDGSAPKRRVKSSWLSTTTPAKSPSVSSSRNVRPRAKGAPRSSKKPLETETPTSSSGSPPPVRVTRPGTRVARPPRVVVASRQSTKLGQEVMPCSMSRPGFRAQTVTSSSESG